MSKQPEELKRAFLATVLCKDAADDDYYLYAGDKLNMEYNPKLSLRFRDKDDPTLAAMIKQLKKVYNGKDYKISIKTLTSAKVHYSKSKNK